VDPSRARGSNGPVVPPPRRIVSLVPSATETVCVLGCADRLVGVTRYCVEPAAELAGVPRIGGTKNPDREAIAAARPDLVLANAEENRPEDIAWLEERFTVLVATPRTVVEAASGIRQLGRMLGLDDEVHALLLEIEAQIARAEVEAFGREPVRVFYPIWRKPWMGVNADTYIHDVLRHAGAENVTAQRAERYPVVEAGELADLGVDLVLLPSEPWEFDEAQRLELTEERVFGEGVPLELVDGRDFCWHGARTPTGLAHAVDLLARHRR